MAEGVKRNDNFGKWTLKAAEFCKSKCPMCVRGREKGRGLLFKMLKIEAKTCPICRAYEKVYGVRVWEKPTE